MSLLNRTVMVIVSMVVTSTPESPSFAEGLTTTFSSSSIRTFAGVAVLVGDENRSMLHVKRYAANSEGTTVRPKCPGIYSDVRPNE